MAAGRQGKRCEDWRTAGHLPLLRQANRTSRCPRVPVLVQSAELGGSAVQRTRVGGAVRAVPPCFPGPLEGGGGGFVRRVAYVERCPGCWTVTSGPGKNRVSWSLSDHRTM